MKMVSIAEAAEAARAVLAHALEMSNDNYTDLEKTNSELSKANDILHSEVAQLTEQRDTRAFDEYCNYLLDDMKTVLRLRAEVAQLKAESQQSEKIRAELEMQLAGAARVLITVEQERDTARKQLDAFERRMSQALNEGDGVYRP